jgi:hypothetical protein
MRFILLGLMFASSFAWAKETQLIGTLDLLIYNAHQVRSVGEWIEKFTPENEKAERNSILQSVLKEKMPAMFRQGDELYFYNAKSGKLETLSVYRINGYDHFELNGKDVSYYPGEPTHDWMARAFGIKNTKKSAFMQMLLPDAEAGFALGFLLGAAVTSAARDNAVRYFPMPQKLEGLDSNELGRLRDVFSSELDKRFPDMAEVEQAKKTMMAMVLNQMHNSTDMQCTTKPGTKYEGAKFTMEIGGHKLTFASNPQDEMPSLNLQISEAGDAKNKSELLFNAASKNFSVRRTVDGTGSVVAGSESSEKDPVAAMVQPWLKEPKAEYQLSKLSSDEAKKLADLINEKAPDAAKQFAMCKWIVQTYMRDSIVHPDRLDRRSHTRAEPNFAAIQYDEVIRECDLYEKAKEAHAKYASADSALWPWSEQAYENEKLSKEDQAADLALKTGNIAYRQFIGSETCGRVKEKTKVSEWEMARSDLQDNVEQERKGRESSHNPATGLACKEKLLEAAEKSDPQFIGGLRARIKAARENNDKANAINLEYSRKQEKFSGAIELAEAATSCCRLKECREAMSAEAKVIKAGGGDSKTADE